MNMDLKVLLLCISFYAVSSKHIPPGGRTPFNGFDVVHKIPGSYTTFEYIYYEYLPKKENETKNKVIYVTEFTHLYGKKNFLITIDWYDSPLDPVMYQSSCTKNGTAINFLPEQFNNLYMGLQGETKKIETKTTFYTNTFEILFRKGRNGKDYKNFPVKHLMIQCRAYATYDNTGVTKNDQNKDQVTSSSIKNEQFRRGFYLDEEEIKYLLTDGANILKTSGF